jgi:hypothetical protein
LWVDERLVAVTVVAAGCFGGLPLPRFGGVLLLLLAVPPALQMSGKTAVLLLAVTANLMVFNVRLWLLLCTVVGPLCGASTCIMAHHMWHTASHGLKLPQLHWHCCSAPNTINRDNC